MRYFISAPFPARRLQPQSHAEQIREVEKMGATTVVLMNNSGADPRGTIGAYGEFVLPALRGVRVG